VQGLGLGEAALGSVQLGQFAKPIVDQRVVSSQSLLDDREVSLAQPGGIGVLASSVKLRNLMGLKPQPAEDAGTSQNQDGEADEEGLGDAAHGLQPSAIAR